MHAALKFILVSLMLVAPALAVPEMSSQQGLTRLFFSSRISQQDPNRAVACFTDYIATSTKISDAYSQEYKNCLQRSADTRKAVDTEVSTEKNAIYKLAQDVCGRINRCNALNNSLDMFSCHAESGSSNTKATYAISTNSSDYVTLLQERYRTIQLNEEKCCALAERVYVKDTTANYDNLQSCLSRQLKPPSTTSTTTSASTTTSTTTTASPTEVPITDVPFTTGAPLELEQLLRLLK